MRASTQDGLPNKNIKGGIKAIMPAGLDIGQVESQEYIVALNQIRYEK